MISALIMAGGKSLRMRASLGRQHKALVKILGVSMLERNILTLLSHSIREIFLAVGADEKSVLSFGRGRGKNLARAAGAKLKIFIEKRPLGTIGAARAIKPTSGDLLIVNVDNLTSLDLSALIDHHRTTEALLTVATHIEPFQVPFGEVSTEDGNIVDYREKPIFPVKLCSGTYVLSKRARLAIPPGKPFGAPALVHKLLRSKQKVSAFAHASAWIDVNDSASVAKAEALIVENFRSFELWREPAATEFVTLFVLKNRKITLERSQPCNVFYSARRSSTDTLPTHDDFTKIANCVLREAGLPSACEATHLISFDELATRSGKRTRHHIFVATMASPRKGPQLSIRRVASVIDPRGSSLPFLHGNSRVIAYLQRYVASESSHSLGYRRPPLRGR